MDYRTTIELMKEKRNKIEELESEVSGLGVSIEDDVAKRFRKIPVELELDVGEKYEVGLDTFLNEIGVESKSIYIRISRTDEIGGELKLSLDMFCKIKNLFDCEVDLRILNNYIELIVYPYNKKEE